MTTFILNIFRCKYLRNTVQEKTISDYDMNSFAIYLYLNIMGHLINSYLFPFSVVGEYIGTCRRVRVTVMTGSISDDWIYWHFVTISLNYNQL
jgi:hypothetical protein